LLFTYPWGVYVDGCIIGRYLAKKDIEAGKVRA